MRCKENESHHWPEQGAGQWPERKAPAGELRAGGKPYHQRHRFGAEQQCADVQGLLRDATIRQRLIDQGGVILGEGPDAFAARIARELAENVVVARESNIRVE